MALVDTDGDALADAWESDGLDLNENGDYDFILLTADPLHKDLYVEVDVMIGSVPSDLDLDLIFTSIEGAFRNAPNSLVNNPDGEDGINLHIERDELDIPKDKWEEDLNGDGIVGDGDGWAAFQNFKNGTSGQGFCSSHERDNILECEAKHWVFRYALLAYSSPDELGMGDFTKLEVFDSASGDYTTTIIGGGSDFYISVGRFLEKKEEIVQAARSQILEGIFMHELGHTLGLGHGGTDQFSYGTEYGQASLNYKPNYHSVMNDIWTFPTRVMPVDGPCYSWSLDYSKEESSTLNEDDLNEEDGLGSDVLLPAHREHCVAIGPRLDKDGKWAGQIVTETGPVDFNGNGNEQEQGLMLDLNFLSDTNGDGKINYPGDATPGDVLRGHEDWSKLRYDFREMPNFQSPVSAPPNFPDEMTIADFEALESLGDGPGVLDFSFNAYEVNEISGQVEIRVTRAVGTAGTISVDVRSTNGSAMAGSDYDPITQTIEFVQGQYQKTFFITITNDSLNEFTESFFLSLTNPTGGAQLGPQTSVEVRIANGNGTSESAFLVTNTNDKGPGSLRQAILDANNDPDLSTISFAIPGSGVQTIRPQSALPAISTQVSVNGYSQPGAQLNTLQASTDAVLLIEISGTNAGNVPGIEITADGSIVRGLVINNFGGVGVYVVNAVDVTISGNYLGTDPSGMTAGGNSRGLWLSGTRNTRVGGLNPQDRNIISGNNDGGLLATGSAWENLILGNYIGVAADGLSPLGNQFTGGAQYGKGNGILLNASHNQIGGTEPGAGNIVAYNAGFGVAIFHGKGNSIRGNSIFSNERLGLSLSKSLQPWRVTYNDRGEQFSLPNQWQNFPVLQSAVRANGTIAVGGVLDSWRNASFEIDFYANREIDPSGYGEGAIYLGSVTVTTDVSGHASFQAVLTDIELANYVVTATATDAAGNTSEYSTRLSTLETLTATLTVNTDDNADDGACTIAHCSLREALHSASNHAGPDTIRFSIDQGYAQIMVEQVLPASTEPVIIDGFTQPGVTNAPLVELRGSPDVEAADASYGLSLRSWETRVSGLIINGFATGILMEASQHVNRDILIESNYIGLDQTGENAVGNRVGIRIIEGQDIVIGGTDPISRNIVSGNSQGIVVDNGSTYIIGNYIGTDSSGQYAVANTDSGVELRRLGSIVGGSAPGEGNVISGNTGHGVILSAGSRLGVITGNLIGLTADRVTLLGNGGAGVHAKGSYHIIGGTTTGSGNVIVGNAFGIIMNTSDSEVWGNFIGTDAVGRPGLGNLQTGVLICGDRNQIGGASTGEGNIIAGNAGNGMVIDCFSRFNSVYGNWIGTDMSQQSDLGNGGHGILIDRTGATSINQGAVRNEIGGLNEGEGNVIAYNDGAGVASSGFNSSYPGWGNSVQANALYSNVGLGIDLFFAPTQDGVTANDENDIDYGPNALQNYPVLINAGLAGNQLEIQGYLNSTASTTFRIEFFYSDAVDPSGYGEGERYVGAAEVTTDSDGQAVFQVIFETTAHLNHWITATATDPRRNTSEFSAAVQVVLGENHPPTASDDWATTSEDDSTDIDVLANDSDVDGDTLAIEVVTQPLTGTTLVSGTSIIYTPTLNFNGDEIFTYTISDGLLTDTALVTITVMPVNDPPQASDDTSGTDEDTAVSVDVLANDNDVDSNLLEIESVTQPLNGVLLIDGISIVYTPTLNFYGDDSFGYTVSDGTLSDSAAVSVTVVAVNDAPLALDDEATTARNAAVTIGVLANDSDVENDVITVVSIADPISGTVELNTDNTVTYTPTLGFVGVDNFTYTVEDGAGGSASATVLVAVELPPVVYCELNPIALSHSRLEGISPGDAIVDIFNGDQPGNFGWLTWSGNPNTPTLVANLTPPGNSDTYVNPNDPADHLVSLNDWVQGKPGVSNAKAVRNALDALLGVEIIVLVWDETEGQGNNTNYRISGFAKVRITDFRLTGQNRISVDFLGDEFCGETDAYVSSIGVSSPVEERTLYLPLLRAGGQVDTEPLLPQQTQDNDDSLHLPDIQR